jgi:hypothetical protein
VRDEKTALMGSTHPSSSFPPVSPPFYDVRLQGSERHPQRPAVKFFRPGQRPLLVACDVVPPGIHRSQLKEVGGLVNLRFFCVGQGDPSDC